MTNETYTTIAAVSSITIACSALVVSWWQLSAQRKHNRLSVTPKLCGNTTKTNGVNHRWSVTNCGVGPAVIKEFLLIIGRDKFSFPSYPAFDSALTGIGCGAYEQAHVFTEEGIFLQVNENLVLLQFKPEEAKKYSEAFEKIRWEIVYESIYGVRDVLKISADEDA